MRKVVLVVGAVAAVVLLALLVRVADRDDRVTYRGSSEQLTGDPGKGQGHGHRHRHHPKKPRHHRGHGAPAYADLTCRMEGGTLVLRYTYGASERVAPFVDARGRGLVAGVQVVGPPRGTVVPSIGLLGEARFPVFGEPAWIRSPDGSDLPCPGKAR